MTSSTGSGAVDAVVGRMSNEKDDEHPERPRDPTPLAPGVWVTEAPGFACVPPRAQSDLRTSADEASHDTSEDCSADKECDTRLSQDEVEPRIERYRER